jgi:predicted membrane-bound spermidine synthase
MTQTDFPTSPSTVAAAPAREAAPPEAAPRWLLLAISFWGGFQIMLLEICGFRVLQTNLGSSVVVTGTLLTIVMVLLSAGYVLGGRTSARRGLGVLFAGLLLSAAYTCAVSALAQPAVTALGLSLYGALSGHVYLRSALPAAFVSLVLYGPPVVLMSMISPFLIRQQTLGATPRAGIESARGQADPGVQSGFFMSLSTLGSIAGTMFTSYLAIPLIGVAWSSAGGALVLFALAAYGWVAAALSGQKRRAIAGAAGVASLLLLAALLLGHKREPDVIYQADSHYGELKVVSRLDAGGRPVLTYHPSALYTHSVLYPGEPLRDLDGSTYLVPALLRPPRSVLILGSAAGGSSRAIEAAFPEAALTGVDLDPKVHEVATGTFGVDPSRVELITADARMYLADTTKQFDFIVVDLFSGEFIPSHCISLEFFRSVRQRLAPGGSVFVNTNMHDIHFELPPGSEPFRPVRHFASTLRAAGFNGLFENSFFHSLFAFPEAFSEQRLRADLLAQLADTARAPSLRAAAGLAAFTTVEVPAAHDRYRPFTDAWTPTFRIELKSNASDVFAALETEHGAPASLGGEAVIEPVLRQHFEEWRDSGDAGLANASALVQRLNAIAAPLGPHALQAASRYLRFSRDFAPNTADPQTPWAKLADLYSRLARHGYVNDYEALLPVLEDLARYSAG